MTSVLYTVYPLDVLFEDEDMPSVTYVRATVSGIPVLVEPMGNGRGRIERVLSTDPEHFLDPTIRPGTTVLLM